MSKKLIGLGVALLAVAVLGVTLPKADVANRGEQGQQGVQGPAGPQGARGADGVSPDLSGISKVLSSLQSLVAGLQSQPKEQKEQKFGAFPGTEITGNTFTVGGITNHFLSSGFQKSTSTICALELPRATTTPIVLSANITTGTSTPLYLVVQTADRPYASALANATGTMVSNILLPANRTGVLTFRASSTNAVNNLDFAVLDGADVFSGRTATTTGNTKGSRYLLFTLRNAGGGTLPEANVATTILGNCKVQLMEL